MPEKKSVIGGKLAGALSKAVANHAKDETKYDSSGSLPSGIDDGRARLVECRIGTYEKGDNKGQQFFYAAGVVLSPESVDGKKVSGKRTSIMEPLCDTPTRSRPTVDDHVAWVLNQLRLLGLDTSELSSDEDLLAGMEALKEAAPVFSFRTWRSEPNERFPNPRTNETWEGVVSDYEEESADMVDDSTKSPPAKPAATKSSSAKPAKREEDSPAQLAKAAQNGDSDAEDRLREMALEAGVSENDIDAADSWADVVSLMEGGGDSGSDSPEVDQIVLYKPKGSKKSVECEVMAVNAKSRTVDLKSLDDGKTFKAVSFDAVAEPD